MTIHCCNARLLHTHATAAAPEYGSSQCSAYEERAVSHLATLARDSQAVARSWWSVALHSSGLR